MQYEGAQYSAVQCKLMGYAKEQYCGAIALPECNIMQYLHICNAMCNAMNIVQCKLMGA